MKKLLESLLEQDIFKPPTEEELEQAKIVRFVKEYDGKLKKFTKEEVRRVSEVKGVIEV